MSSEPLELELELEHPSGMHGRDLTTGSIPRHLIAFSLPMLMGSAIQTAYSVVNAIWVGRGIGSAALAAVTVSFPVIFILMAVAGGLTMAANILASQSYGAKDWPQLKRVIQNSTVLTLVLSVVIVIAGQVSSEHILRLIDTPADVLPMAAGYLRIILLSMPFMFAIFLLGSLLRGVGDSKTPLYFQAVFLGVNAVLDPLFMFGWLGFPKLGLNGTAVATIIAQGGSVLMLSAYLHWKRHIVQPHWTNLSLNLDTSLLTLKIGIPSMIQQALVSIGMLFIVGLVNAYGEEGTAAFGAASRIDQIALMPALTIGMAISTLAGQNIGAGHHHRVKEVFKWGMLLSCGITLIPSLAAVIFPGILLRMFISDQHVIDLGTQYLRIVGGGYVCFSVMFVSNGVINGAGHTFVTTLISLIGLWFIRVPLATYLSHHMHRLEGIWYAMLISFATGSLISVIYYLSGRWRRPIRKKVVSDQSIVNSGEELP